MQLIRNKFAKCLQYLNVNYQVQDEFIPKNIVMFRIKFFFIL